MIANYGICSVCSEFIENDSHSWRDLEGYSFKLIPKDDGYRYHRHTPMSAKNFKGLGKYTSLYAEILDSLAIMGYASDSVGDQETFGFYDLFSDYNAILVSYSSGTVDAVFYDDVETTEQVWQGITRDYEDFTDEEYADESCNCGSYSCDYFYQDED